jgi:hypothetical protein
MSEADAMMSTLLPIKLALEIGEKTSIFLTSSYQLVLIACITCFQIGFSSSSFKSCISM